MQMHINKSLKTWCQAIQTALCKFNAAAKAIDCPGLEWSEISTYGSLAAFALLRKCHEDIHSLPWTDAANQQATILTLKTRGVANAKHSSTIPSALNDKIYYVDQRLSLQLKGIVVRT